MKTTKSVKVLTALDNDKTALKGVETGYALVKRLDAEITLLHSMTDLIFYASTKHLPQIKRTDSKSSDPPQIHVDEQFIKESQQFLEKMKHLLNDESFVNSLQKGDFDDNVLLNSKGECTEVLVTGAQSHRWLKDLVPGSENQKVVSRTFVPAYIIPSKQRDRVSMI